MGKWGQTTKPRRGDRKASPDGFSRPLALKGNLPGHEIEYPMAIVILGGLVTSTMLNLFLLPALYAKVGGTKSAASAPNN